MRFISATLALALTSGVIGMSIETTLHTDDIMTGVSSVENEASQPMQQRRENSLGRIPSADRRAACGNPGTACTLANFKTVCCPSPDGKVACELYGDFTKGRCYFPK